MWFSRCDGPARSTTGGRAQDEEHEVQETGGGRAQEQEAEHEVQDAEGWRAQEEERREGNTCQTFKADKHQHVLG